MANPLTASHLTSVSQKGLPHGPAIDRISRQEKAIPILTTPIGVSSSSFGSSASNGHSYTYLSPTINSNPLGPQTIPSSSSIYSCSHSLSSLFTQSSSSMGDNSFQPIHARSLLGPLVQMHSSQSSTSVSSSSTLSNTIPSSMSSSSANCADPQAQSSKKRKALSDVEKSETENELSKEKMVERAHQTMQKMQDIRKRIDELNLQVDQLKKERDAQLAEYNRLRSEVNNTGPSPGLHFSLARLVTPEEDLIETLTSALEQYKKNTRS